MDIQNKGVSPFDPGKPAPIELFTGRKEQIDRIVRTASQVALGKPKAMFLAGEYGIGKSSLANYMRLYLEREFGLFGIHVFLRGAKTVDDLSARTVETILRTTIYEPTALGKVRNALSKYVGKQELFGITIDLEKLKIDSPNISSGFLPFLGQMLEKLEESRFKGIFLILDEINGIASNPDFAHFIKTLVDENALSPKPVPLFLLLCGVEERRADMIKCHPPIGRIFDVIDVERMTKSEMEEFFKKAFGLVDISIDEDALTIMSNDSSGFPTLMHLIGDSVFWRDSDKIIDTNDAVNGIFDAAEIFGRKYIDTQVLQALQSEDYHSILKKLSARLAIGRSTFHKNDIEQDLSPTEKKKYNNFLQRMKKLNALQAGEKRGEYIFTNSLIALYVQLKNIDKEDT